MSKASGALIITISILLAIYSILQFLIAPRENGIENARRHTTYVYGIPIPPISRVVSIIVLIILLALSSLLFLIGKLYYGAERIFSISSHFTCSIRSDALLAVSP